MQIQKVTQDVAKLPQDHWGTDFEQDAFYFSQVLAKSLADLLDDGTSASQLKAALLRYSYLDSPADKRRQVNRQNSTHGM